MQDKSFKDKELPNILIVGETPFSDNAAGTIQTMFNLFKNYPKEKIFCIANDYNNQGLKNNNYYFPSTFFLKTTFIPILRNRLGKFLNPVIEKFNYWIRMKLPIYKLKDIEKFKPDVLLLCPNSPLHLGYGLRIQKRIHKALIVYFMDDWMQQGHFSNFFKVEENTSFVLKESKSWLMISKELNNILQDRYAITNKQVLIVQNPVSVGDTIYPNYQINKESIFTIIYAGSIWPMHFDALENFAKSVFLLRQKNEKIKLVIYTFQHFWEYRGPELRKYEVEYGGFLNHSELRKKLIKGDLLLVTSSFLPEWKSHSCSSVQTKITDYMIARKPIFSYGPLYSACNRFVKEYEAGFISSEQDLIKLSKELSAIISKRENLIQIGEQNYSTALREFETEKVITKLYSFIKETIFK